MTEPDPLAVLLKDLDQPATPPPEFAAALRTRVLAELTDPAGPRARRRVPHLRPAWLARHWRPVLAGALACAVAATAIVAVVLSRPAPASALDVILAARKAFAAAPPFEATLRVELNPGGSNPGVPKGAVATVLMSYGGAGRFRTQIVAVKPRFPGSASPGSYQVFNRHTIATFDSQQKQFSSTFAPRGFRRLTTSAGAAPTPIGSGSADTRDRRSCRTNVSPAGLRATSSAALTPETPGSCGSTRRPACC